MSGKQFKTYDKDVRQRWNNQRVFRLGKVPISVYNPFIVFPMTKFSPLYDVFNPIVLRLQAGDIIEQLARFYFLDFQEEVEEREAEPIKVTQILTGAWGCAIGLALAIIAFIMETYPGQRKTLVKRISQRRLKNIKYYGDKNSAFMVRMY